MHEAAPQDRPDGSSPVRSLKSGVYAAKARGILAVAHAVALAGTLVTLLAACAPAAQVLAPPTFSFDAAASGFVRIDPPGVGDGAALFRLALNVENPNAVPVKLAGLDGTLFLADQRAAAVSFRGAIDIAARGSSPLILDVIAPLGAAPALLDTIGNYLSGSVTSFQVDAAVTMDVLGAPQRFPAFTLFRGDLPQLGGLLAPKLALQGSHLRFEAVNSVVLQLDVRLTNPGAIGYFAAAPQLWLLIGGAEAATIGLEPVAVPGAGSADVKLTFRFDPLGLGAALAAQVQAASVGLGGLSVTLAGAWSLDAPGLASLTLQPTTLVTDVLR